MNLSAIWGIFPALPPALGALIELPRVQRTSAKRLRRNTFDLIGRSFGTLTVNAKLGARRAGGMRWGYDCQCGGTGSDTTYNLLEGIRYFCSRMCPMRRVPAKGGAK